MNTLKQSLKFLLLMLGLIAQSAGAAQIIVTVDRNPVNINESFQILFNSNESPDGMPDFSALERSFTILNQSQRTSASLVNGKASKNIQWTLDVMAKEAGPVTVPAIAFGKDMSDPLTIEVTKADDNKAANVSEDIFLEVEATPQKPYLQS